MSELLKILPPHLIEGLTLAEELLLETVCTGEYVDFRINKKLLTNNYTDYCLADTDPDNPKNSDGWGLERMIRAELLNSLCTDDQVAKLVHSKGIQIYGAKIEGDIDFDNAIFPRPLMLLLCALGKTAIRRAEIRLIDFSGSFISSISADGLILNGPLFLRGIKTRGTVRLLGANIGGQVSCNGAEFINPDGKSLCVDGLVVNGSFLLKKIKVTGEARFLGAKIDGQFDCEGAIFENPDGYAFNADGIETSGNCFLKRVKATGEVRLPGAKIGRQLDCTGAVFDNPKSDALNIQAAEIKGPIILREIKLLGILNLSYAHVTTLVDEENGWPEKGKLSLAGFEYNSIAIGSITTAKKRLDWIRLQGSENFSLQPYEQLAKVFRQMGHESEAKEILIGKNKDICKFGNIKWYSWLWNKFIGLTIAYGYKPWRAGLGLLGFFIFGCFLFHQANETGLMEITKERVYMDESYSDLHITPPQYPEFNSCMYSLDTLIPVLDLHQEEYRLPKAGFYRGYLWFHIICGWILTTLGLASLTGLIKKE